jgi:hypothetical protein
VGASNITLQNVVDVAQVFGDIEPVFNQAGYSAQPALTIANDVMNAICAVPFPWKWNAFNLPTFLISSLQQDYAILGLTTLSYLQRGIVIDVQNTSISKPWRNVEVGRELTQALGNWQATAYAANPLFLCNYLPNFSLYYGTWGSANTGNNTIGNNPVAGSVYVDPLTQGSVPPNPITQIRDANGNLLVITTFGTEGNAAPLAPPNSSAGTTVSGTGASTIWTVVDPNGQGIRIFPPPTQSGPVWQFNLVGQRKPVRFTSLGQKLDPLPDDMEPHFRAGFIAQCYRYSPEAKIRAKFKDEWTLWQKSLYDMRVKEDREPEENMFVPDRGIMGRSRRTGQPSPYWPFASPQPY